MTWGSDAYGATFSEVYDEWYEDRLDTSAAVDYITSLAPGGTVLELGSGTGRITLALAARGVRVTGIESSEDMIVRMRAKPGGENVPIIRGDFAAVPAAGPFDVICVPFSSLFLLPDQEAQVRCFVNAARVLAEDGHLVIEAFVPDAGRYANGQYVQLEHQDHMAVRLEVAQHDPVTQRIDATRIVITEAGTRLFPFCLRYATHAELDLMALHAGLELVERSAGYARQPFCETSTMHVSRYRVRRRTSEATP